MEAGGPLTDLTACGPRPGRPMDKAEPRRGLMRRVVRVGARLAAAPARSEGRPLHPLDPLRPRGVGYAAAGSPRRIHSRAPARSITPPSARATGPAAAAVPPGRSSPLAPAPRPTGTARSPLPASRAVRGARWLPSPEQRKPGAGENGEEHRARPGRPGERRGAARCQQFECGEGAARDRRSPPRRPAAVVWRAGAPARRSPGSARRRLRRRGRAARGARWSPVVAIAKSGSGGLPRCSPEPG